MTDTNKLPQISSVLAELVAEQKWPHSALQSRAQVQGEVCPTCGETEPYTGSCGKSNNDTKALCKKPAQATQAEVTDEQILSLDCVSIDSDEHGTSFWVDRSTVIKFARTILALRPSTAPNLACKSVQARLAAQWGYVRPAAVPMTEEQRTASWLDSPVDASWATAEDAYNQGIQDAEAHHGITAQAKKEGA